MAGYILSSLGGDLLAAVTSPNRRVALISFYLSFVVKAPIRSSCSYYAISCRTVESPSNEVMISKPTSQTSPQVISASDFYDENRIDGAATFDPAFWISSLGYIVDLIKFPTEICCNPGLSSLRRFFRLFLSFQPLHLRIDFWDFSIDSGLSPTEVDHGVTSVSSGTVV